MAPLATKIRDHLAFLHSAVTIEDMNMPGYRLQQYNPPHPGELIRRTYIEPFEGISGNMLAKRLGVAESTFNRLLNGVSAVSPETAVRLSRVLGRSPESWLLLQDQFDLWKARRNIDVQTLEPVEFGAG